MAIRRMDNVGIVVDDLGAAIGFFRALGLELEGRAMVEGEWAGRVTGLGDQQVEIAMMSTPPSPYLVKYPIIASVLLPVPTTRPRTRFAT